MLGGLLSAGLGIGGGLFSTISGAIQTREATEALENYERKELQNMAEGLRVSTLGSDLAREEAGRLAMGQVDALQAGGQRALLGGLGRVEARNTDLNRQIGADLDKQQMDIDQQVLNENQRIRQMQENRENADIAALSSQINTGNQNMMGGIGNIIQGTGMLGGILGAKPNNDNTPYVTPASATSVNTESFYQTPMNLSPQGQGASLQQPMLTPQAVIPSQANNFGITRMRGIAFNPYQQPK